MLCVPNHPCNTMYLCAPGQDLSPIHVLRAILQVKPETFARRCPFSNRYDDARQGEI